MMSLFHKIPVLIFIWILLVPRFVWAQQSQMTPQDQIDQFVLDQMRRHRVPSVAIGIVQNGEITYTKAYDLNTNSRPTTIDSLFFLGSSSKLITAVGLLVLEDQGKLALNDPAHMHLPQPLGSNLHTQAPYLTISHLLEHRSGISRWSGYFHGESELSTNDITFAHQPGTTYEYSSMNYILLGKIIEHVSHKSYADLMRQEVFEPWGMQHTATDLSEVNKERLVPGHMYVGFLPIPVPPTDAPDQLVPMGYIASSVSDMSLLLKNVSKLDYFTDRKFNQAGMDRGYSSRVVWLPEKDTGVVILTNVNSFTASSHLLNGVTTLLNGEQVDRIFAIELLVRFALVCLFLYEVFRLFKEIVWWRKNGYVEERNWLKKRKLIRFLFDVFLNIGLFAGVLLYFSITPGALLHIQPDLGVFLIVGTIVGLIRNILKVVVISNDEKEEVAV